MSKKTKFIVFLFSVFFLYQASKWTYGQASGAYFDYKSENYAGEFIYRTVENVEGLYQMRLRDPRDYFDRMRKGDIPEDPYGHTNIESQRPWQLFVTQANNKYLFFETTKEPELRGHKFDYDHLKFSEIPVFTGQKYWRYDLSDTPYDAGNYLIYRKATQTSELKSKYGFTWRGISNEWDKIFSVYGGEIVVQKLSTKEILAKKIGFVLINNFSKKGGVCPKDKKDGFFIYEFISKVLKPKSQ